MKRRWFLLAALSPLLHVGTAEAGTYLRTANLLIKAGASDANALREHLGDKEMAKVVQGVAAARLDIAGHIVVPSEVVQAHPHLLLVLENYERAAFVVADGKPDRYLVYIQRAQQEEAILRGVIKQLGFSLDDKK